MRIIDANILLRYLLEDEPLFAKKAAAILENGSVYIPFEALAEVVYVMLGLYHATRSDISSVLLQLTEQPNVSTSNLSVLQEALRLFENKKLDFVDSLLCAYSRIEGAQIETFDKKLAKCCSGH